MITHTPYDPTHPTALAVYCSDGRFTRAVEELLQGLGYGRLDTLTIPGGPAHLSPQTATYAEGQLIGEAASFLISSHHVSHVVLLAHDGCGHYKQRLFGMDEAYVHEQQLADLHEARHLLIRAHAGLDVRAFYATVENDAVRFDEVL